jgi:two-component system, chemotaxis family, protein-glutamate methylesterase/glutaminase
VYIAPGNAHLKVAPAKNGKGYMAVLDAQTPLTSGHRPSVDVLFDSVAQHLGGKAVGIILTGMGRDGAEGLLKMRQSGCHTLGQNRETCVVYGMPKAAFEIGAVCQELPLDQIAAATVAAFSATQRMTIARAHSK